MFWAWPWRGTAISLMRTRPHCTELRTPRDMPKHRWAPLSTVCPLHLLIHIQEQWGHVTQRYFLPWILSGAWGARKKKCCSCTSTYCIATTLALRLCCIGTARVLHSYRLGTALVLHSFCCGTTLVSHIQSFGAAWAWRWCSTRTALVLTWHCTGIAPVLHRYSTGTAPVLSWRYVGVSVIPHWRCTVVALVQLRVGRRRRHPRVRQFLRRGSRSDRGRRHLLHWRRRYVPDVRLRGARDGQSGGLASGPCGQRWIRTIPVLWLSCLVVKNTRPVL